VVRVTPRPLSSRGKSPRTHWIRGWVDPRAGLDDVEKKNVLTLPGLELRSFCRPARSQSLYRLRYPGSQCYLGVIFKCYALLYRVYQNSTAKVQDCTHTERGKKKVYDNMGPEMHNYRVIRSCNLRSSCRNVLFARIKMRDNGYNCYTSNHVANQFNVGGDGFLQMSFSLTIYALGSVPDTSDAPPKHYHPPYHTCNACSPVLLFCT
jgi:hypothetical protein